MKNKTNNFCIVLSVERNMLGKAIYSLKQDWQVTFG